MAGKEMMFGAAVTESSIQYPEWADPLSIEIVDDLSFDGIIPGPEGKYPAFREFIEQTLTRPPWEKPEGELTFDDESTWFHYQLFESRRWHPAPRRHWLVSAFGVALAPWTFGRRGTWEIFSAVEVANYLEAEWFARFGHFVRRPAAPVAVPAPSAPVFPPLSLAMPAEPLVPQVKLSSRRRGLLQMAQEMEMDAGVLEEQLESGVYDYVVSLLVECQSMVKTGDGYGTYEVRREYLFDKADAEHNIAHRNEPGTVTIKKKEMGK